MCAHASAAHMCTHASDDMLQADAAVRVYLHMWAAAHVHASTDVPTPTKLPTCPRLCCCRAWTCGLAACPPVSLRQVPPTAPMAACIQTSRRPSTAAGQRRRCGECGAAAAPAARCWRCMLLRRGRSRWRACSPLLSWRRQSSRSGWRGWELPWPGWCTARQRCCCRRTCGSRPRGPASGVPSNACRCGLQLWLLLLPLPLPLLHAWDA